MRKDKNSYTELPAIDKDETTHRNTKNGIKEAMLQNASINKQSIRLRGKKRMLSNVQTGTQQT
jgi:hypothetical protein